MKKEFLENTVFVASNEDDRNHFENMVEATNSVDPFKLKKSNTDTFLYENSTHKLINEAGIQHLYKKLEPVEQIELTQISMRDGLYQQDKALIDAQFIIAKGYPRDLKKAIDNAIVLATIDDDTAFACTYAVPGWGKTITGPSVHLARIIANQWGNLRVESKVVEIDTKNITSQALAFDMENNLAIKIEVKKSITTPLGKMSEDMVTASGNAANAIALRNAVFSVIPKSVVDKVYKAVTEFITGDLSTKGKLNRKVNSVFARLIKLHALTEKEILSAIGKSTIDQVSEEDLLFLIGVNQAIKDRDTTVYEAFRKSDQKRENGKLNKVEQVSNIKANLSSNIVLP